MAPAPWIWLLAAGTISCTSQPAVPSSLAERKPTPGTVTRDNPAGDAKSPVDAALTRLLVEPIGIKNDKFMTLRPVFADARNWKRVRFWGQPTRAGFRYGEDAYAMAVVLYSEAPDDDPQACLAAVVQRAQRLAAVYDLEIAPLARELREHPRGFESLDLDALGERSREAYAVYERKRERRRQRLLRWQLKRARARQGEDSRALSKATLAKAQGQPQLSARQERARQRRERARRKHVRVATMRRMIAELDAAPMPVVRTSGEFETLLSDDRYLAAVVAYRSWPGTCLVQGFAAQVGSDESLSRRVVERWLDEQAPALKWRLDLPGQPAIKNR